MLVFSIGVLVLWFVALRGQWLNVLKSAFQLPHPALVCTGICQQIPQCWWWWCFCWWYMCYISASTACRTPHKFQVNLSQKTVWSSTWIRCALVFSTVICYNSIPGIIYQVVPEKLLAVFLDMFCWCSKFRANCKLMPWLLLRRSCCHAAIFPFLLKTLTPVL